jgi:hypothetical protein
VLSRPSASHLRRSVATILVVPFVLFGLST